MAGNMTPGTSTPAEVKTPGTGRACRNPWAWIPSLYLAEGLPYALAMSVSVVLYKNLDVSNTAITFYTIVKSKRLSDFLEALSDERMPTAAKFKSLLDVWRKAPRPHP